MTLTLFIIEMIFLGIGAGIISGALGLGGGIIMVPAFIIFVPEMDPHTAKGTSLFIIIFIAAINAWRQTRTWESIPWHLVISLAMGSVVGSYLGSWITNILPGQFILGIFIVLLLVLAYKTFFLQPPKVDEEEMRKHTGLAITIGLLAGIAGGATGTGGGSVLIPLVLLAGLISNEKTVGLSNLVMVATAAAGSIANLQAATIYPDPRAYGLIFFTLVPVVFIGSQIGSPIGRRINPMLTLSRRKTVMAALILFITLRMCWEFIGGIS